MTRLRILAILCAASASLMPPLVLGATPAPAADSFPSPVVPGQAMPARENGLVTILTDAARQYARQRTVQQRTAVRLAMQSAIAKFMRESQEAQNWVGVVKASRRTADGDTWLAIDIAPDVSLSTLQDRGQDSGYQTLIHGGSPLRSVADQLTVGQPVTFDGTMLIFDVSDDDAMMQRPQIITRFRKITPIEH